MNTMKCPNCGGENKNTNIRCEFCGMELKHIEHNDNFLNKDYSQENVKTIHFGSKTLRRSISAVLIFFLAPWFLGVLILIGFSVHFKILDYNQSKDYLETEGELVRVFDCYHNGDGAELCEAQYQYIVDGISYTASPNLETSHSMFKQKLTVKYDPSNPSEYVVDLGWNSGWNLFLIIGIAMVMLPLLMIMSIKVVLKKVFQQAKKSAFNCEVTTESN